MHILEQYSLNCGLKISKPFIYEKYFPTPCEKYITFNPFGKFESRKYNYWQEVIDILHPFLEKNGIKILQIGGKNEASYINCIGVMGQTDFNQTAYIIKNSLLHFGVDSFPIHLASAYDKKIVAIYCNMYSGQSKPYWSTEKNIRLIQADRKGKKPSYSPEENPKTINNIKPEEIAKNILDLLQIDYEKLPETIFIGNRYENLLIEAVPDTVLPKEIFVNNLLNLRFDYLDSIEELHYQNSLNNLFNRKCAIITNKTIEIEKLIQFKNQIHNVFYDISQVDPDINFINKIKMLGLNISLIFNKDINPNEDDLNSKKLLLIDFPDQINIIINILQSIELTKTANFYKSRKIVFGRNKTYLSYQAYKEDKPINLDNNLNSFQNLNEINDIENLVKIDGQYIMGFK